MDHHGLTMKNHRFDPEVLAMHLLSGHGHLSHHHHHLKAEKKKIVLYPKQCTLYWLLANFSIWLNSVAVVNKVTEAVLLFVPEFILPLIVPKHCTYRWPDLK